MEGSISIVKESLFVRTIKYFVGVSITALGVVIIFNANLGSSASATLTQGLGLFLKVSPGTANIFMNVVFLTLALLFDRKRIGLGTLFSTFAFGLSINMWSSIIGESFMFPNLYGKIALCIVGIIIESYGLSYYMKSSLGYGSMELVADLLSKTFKITFAKSKQFMDFTLMVTGIILGGTIGIGTVLGVVLIGYFVDRFLQGGKI